MYRSILIVLLLTVGAFAFGAEVYKTEDENGRIIYTDKPPRDGQKAEKMDLPSVNTVPAPAVRERESTPPTVDTVPKSYQVAIVSPEPESHVNPGQMNLTIQVATEPSLFPRHQVIIYDNGQAVGTGTSVTIENIFRGTHTIQARVLDQQGRVIGQSQAIQVYVHRPTVNSPARN